MAWNEAWGTYAKSGAQYDVAFVGSPSSSSLGLNLTKAKARGHGRGIQFTSLNNEGTSVRVELSLIGMSATNGRWSGNNNTGYASPNGTYTARGWTYEWFVDIYISTNGGSSYSVLRNNIKVASHATPMALAYNENGSVSHWSNANIEWSAILTLPSNFTHIKFEVRGEEPAQRHQNVYGREIVIPPPTMIKPWAIRKSGSFKTLDRDTGFFKSRNSNRWVDKSSVRIDQVGLANEGVSRIRKSGTFKCQGKIGNN